MTFSDDLSNPDSPILNTDGLARLMQISEASIASMRSRDPIKLPPPFLRRPLRWRREAVLKWMEDRERIEQLRIDRTYPSSMTGRAEPSAPLGSKKLHNTVRRVCAISGTLRGHGMRTRLRRGSKRKLLAKREFDSGPTTSAMPQLLDKIYTLDSRPRRQHATTGGRRHG